MSPHREPAPDPIEAELWTAVLEEIEAQARVTEAARDHNQAVMRLADARRAWEAERERKLVR